MDEESLHIRYLAVIAAVLCVLIVGYNAFYVPDVSLTGITTVTDTSSASSGEEYIPRFPESAGGNVSALSGSNASSSIVVQTGKININTATAQQLSDGLDGIGEVMAKRIVDYRKQNGSFKTIAELKNVSGIGDKTFEKLESSVTIDGQ